MRTSSSFDRRLEAVGIALMRYALVVIIMWFGAFKFTPAEAQAIQPLVANSPLLSWVHSLTDVRGASDAIGVVEILIAALIVCRFFAPALSAAGSLAARPPRPRSR